MNEVAEIQAYLDKNNLPPVPGRFHKFKPGTQPGFQA